MADFIVLPRAQIEIARIYEFIADQSPTQAELVYAALIERFASIAANPLLYPRYRPNSPLRKWVGRGKLKSYLIYYRYVGEKVEFIRVIHGMRNQSALLDDSSD